MGTRRSWLVLLVLFLPASVRADDHWAELSAAASGAHLSSLGGVQVTAAFAVDHVTPAAVAKLARHWSVIIDASAHVVGKHDNVDLNQYTVGLGLRRTLVRYAYRSWVPFLQGTIGGAFSVGSTLDGNRAAVAFGGGIDRVGKRQGSSRGLKKVGFAWRFYGDIVFPASGAVNWYPRLSTGLVLRIKET